MQKRGNSWVRGWCETAAGRGKQCWPSRTDEDSTSCIIDLIASRGRALSAKLQPGMRREPNEDIRNCTGRRVSARGLRLDPDWRARSSCPPPPAKFGWVVTQGMDIPRRAFFSTHAASFHTHHTHDSQISSGWLRRPPYLQTSGELASHSPIYEPRASRPEDGESEQSLDYKI